MKGLLVAALLGTINGAALACDPGLSGAGVVRVESNRYVIAYRTEPADIKVGEHLALELAVCAKNGSAAPDSLRVDAYMPAHRHGMNYAATVKRTAAGRWRAEGLLFHMPGDWEFRFDIRAAGATDRLSHRYQLD